MHRSLTCAKLILTFTMTLSAVSGCKKKQTAVPEAHAAPVTVADAVARDVPVYIDEIGRAVASEVVSIQAQATGRITEIGFKDGADVKKGDLLFKLDARPYEAALAQARAAAAESQAALNLAKKEWERVEGLQQSNAMSKEQIEQRQNAVAVADAQLQASKAAIETAEVNLEYTTIRSPIDGRAGQRLVDLGNIVTASAAQSLLTIQKLDPVYADFIISEDRLPEVRQNMANHTLKTLVWTPDKTSDAPREGELTFLDNAVNSQSGTVKLRATIPNADHHFWPGQFVKIRLVLHVKSGAVLVPQRAIQLGQQGQFVYLVKPSGDAKALAAVLQPVTVGQKQGEEILIDKGVVAGDQVVVTGQMMLQPGAPVNVTANETKQPPAPAPATQPADVSATPAKSAQ